MDHPHIARVLDAGTTPTGRPYFAMELVEGIPITRYCDERRLGLRERLELFALVCLAVQHAHQKGIIHRDLKPTNILVGCVDGRAVPKIIDLGLAQAMEQSLADQTRFTLFGQIVGTIDYMSPEQASLDRFGLDTRTDVYSLGVLLYELLTGETPFGRERCRRASFDEPVRVADPSRPGRRARGSPAVAATGQRGGTRSGSRTTDEKAPRVCISAHRRSRHLSGRSIAGTLVNLTRNPAADSGPAWSPDGTRIAFESTRTGNYDVFVMNADGSEPRRLTNYADEDRMPVWSPDGRFLCFRRRMREPRDHWELAVMDAEGTSVRNFSNHPASETDPAWSVLDRIAFGSNRGEERWSVFTMNPDGSDVRNIRKFTTGWFPHPCWSPDGKRLAFTAVAYQHRQICVMDADGRNERRLTNLKGLSVLASWSPDGRHIAFMHRADHFPQTVASLYVMRSDGTELTEVGPVEGHINGGRPGWKP